MENTPQEANHYVSGAAVADGELIEVIPVGVTFRVVRRHLDGGGRNQSHWSEN